MSQFNLSAPVTIDPRQGLTVHLRSIKAEKSDGAILITVDWKDSGGNVVKTDSRKIAGPGAVAWIANQEQSALTAYANAAGLTGTYVP